MRVRPATSDPKRWSLYGTAALSILALASIPVSSSGAVSSRTLATQSAASADGRARPSVTKAAKTRRHPRIRQRRRAQATIPQFFALSNPYPARVGQRLTVTVRLYGGNGAARSAAFHVLADPSLVRYVGAVPSGAGALLVKPSRIDGELVVYRSSVPEGFLATESLVELEYEALGPGDTSIVVTDARLFDGAARELKSTHESGGLVIE